MGGGWPGSLQTVQEVQRSQTGVGWSPLPTPPPPDARMPHAIFFILLQGLAGFREWLIFNMPLHGWRWYRLCTSLNPFLSPLKLPKEVKCSKIPNSHLECFACCSAYQVEIPQVSMAALKQPTSFKVVKFLEGNAASRSGQPGEGRRGSGKKRRHLHGSDIWDQNTRCGKEVQAHWGSFSFGFRSRLISVAILLCLSVSSSWCHFFTLEISVVGTKSCPGCMKLNQKRMFLGFSVFSQGWPMVLL